MPGRYGLTIATSALLVWIGRWLNLGGLRDLDLRWVQVINILFCVGLACCIVNMLGRYWAAVRQPD